MDAFYSIFNENQPSQFGELNKILFLTNWDGLTIFSSGKGLKSLFENDNKASLCLGRFPFLNDEEIERIFFPKGIDSFFILIFNKENFTSVFQENLAFCNIEFYPVQKNKMLSFAIPPKTFSPLNDSIEMVLQFFYDNIKNYKLGEIKIKDDLLNRLTAPHRLSIEKLKEKLDELPTDAKNLEIFVNRWNDKNSILNPIKVLYPLGKLQDVDIKAFNKIDPNLVFEPFSISRALKTNDSELIYKELREIISHLIEN